MRGIINKDKFNALLKDGMRVMVGGFLTNGTPEGLIDLVVKSNIKDLTIIRNDGGYPYKGVGKLIANGQARKLIASHIGTNPVAGDLMQSGDLEVELVPQGTLAERIRAYGAGLGGILTPTGLDTVVEDGKKIMEIKGIRYLLEEALGGDIALVGGAIADKYGNLRFNKTMRNFNPLIATACEIVVVEPLQIIDEIDPENVITPHPFVDYLLAGEKND